MRSKRRSEEAHVGELRVSDTTRVVVDGEAVFGARSSEVEAGQENKVAQVRSGSLIKGASFGDQSSLSMRRCTFILFQTAVKPLSCWHEALFCASCSLF